MTSPPSNRKPLPGWVVPVTALVVVGVLATLLLTLRSHRSPAELARETAQNFVAALNSHDVSTAQEISCADYSAQAQQLADELNKTKTKARLQSMRTLTSSHEQAVVPAGQRTLVLDIEEQGGLWLVCGQS